MIFNYINRTGVSSKYFGIIPTGFFECPGSPSCRSGLFMSAYDIGNKKYKEFCVEKITNVLPDINVLDALLDISNSDYFWNGDLGRTGKNILSGDLLAAINAAIDIPDKDQVVLDWLREHVSETTKTIAGPSTDIEHEAYSIYVDGIPIYFDDLNDAAVTLAREIVSGAVLPKILRDLIVGIQIVEEDARGGPDVIGMSADGFITIYGDRQVDMGVIAHEAAHDFAVQKWGDSIPPEDSDYSAAINTGEPVVSEYSKRNAGEDFAEAVGMFVTDPVGQQKIAPLRYNVIQRLMEGV